jgi:hypothetical protein
MMDAQDWLEDYERVKKSTSSTPARQANLRALHESLSRMEEDPRSYDLRDRRVPWTVPIDETAIKHARSKAEARRRRRLLDALRFAPEAESPTAYATRATESRIEEQEALMRKQDSAISEIRMGVEAVHDLSYQLRDETHLHVGLLDDVNSDVEDAHAGLRQETRAAETFGKRSGECPLYVTIVANTAVIVALLVYGLRD